MSKRPSCWDASLNPDFPPPTTAAAVYRTMITKTASLELSELHDGHHNDATPTGRDADVVASTVPDRYRGTEADHHDMRALGKTQVLRRNFKLLGMIAFANSVMVMWETFLEVCYLGLSVGGRAAVFWGLIYGAVAMTCVYVTIAEMASM